MIQFNDKILDLITQNEYWVLSHLLKRCDKDMCCFPSTETLMKDCDMGKNTIQNTINSLAKKGFIEKKQRFIDGRQSSNNYKITSFLISKYSKTNSLLENNSLVKNQQSVNLQLTEKQLTEKQQAKVLITSLESINHSFESINQTTTTTSENENFEKIENPFWESSLKFQKMVLGKSTHTIGLRENELIEIFEIFKKENIENSEFDKKGESFFNEKFGAFCFTWRKEKEKSCAKKESEVVEKFHTSFECIAAVQKYFIENPEEKNRFIEAARFYEGQSGTFDDELVKFVNHNSTNIQFAMDPTSLRNLRNLTNWLIIAKNKPKQNFSQQNYQKNGTGQQQQQANIQRGMSDWSKY